MDEVKRLKLHIRVLYCVIAAVIAWTVVLALLPPKSHYRDVLLSDVEIKQEDYLIVITAKRDIIGYSVKYKLNGEFQEREYGDIERGHKFSIGLGGDDGLGGTIWKVTDIQIFGKINTHLE